MCNEQPWSDKKTCWYKCTKDGRAGGWKLWIASLGRVDNKSIKSFCNSLTRVRGSSREFTGTCSQRRVKVLRALSFACERRLKWGEEVHRWWDRQIGSTMTELFDVIKFWSDERKGFGKLRAPLSWKQISKKVTFPFPVQNATSQTLLGCSWGTVPATVYV